jgi:UDP-N-acetylmuramate dehydrogenase
MSIIIQENVPLAPFTTMKIGGPARYFIEVGSEEEAREALEFARFSLARDGEKGNKGKNLPILILGGGSNILVSDAGFPGVVIRNKIGGFDVEACGKKARVRVGAGENWDDFVARVVEMDWAGLENLSGIPGSVGAAPVQNIGAYGVSVEETIVEVRGINTRTLKTETLHKKQCAFGYRDSIFKRRPNNFFITQVVFELIPGGRTNVSAYPDVRKYFEGWQKPPSLKEMRRAIIEIRSRKGMVIMPGYESFLSVGSFFKNPVVSREKFEKIKTSCPIPWFWEMPDGRIKISAACLIEQSGFSKGYKEGRVGISPKQPLALINLGGASAREVSALAEKIKSAVKDKFGINLEAEAQFVG